MLVEVLWSAAGTGLFSVLQIAESVFSLVLDTESLQKYTMHSTRYRTGTPICCQNAYRTVSCITSIKVYHLWKRAQSLT